MIAGSLAGMAEHIAMFPVDTIKARMQAISTPGSQVGRPLTASKPVFSPRPTLFFFGSANGKWNRLLTTDFFFFASSLASSLLRFLLLPCEGVEHNFESHELCNKGRGDSGSVSRSSSCCDRCWVSLREKESKNSFLGRGEGKKTNKSCTVHFASNQFRFKTHFKSLPLRRPSHGIYFAVYEYMKILLGANDGGHRPLETSVAAIAATCVGDAVMTPLDVVKQRLQLANTPYKGILDCVATTLRKEGMRAFFKSYNTTIFMNIPFVSIHFASYESCKKMLRKSPEDEGLMTQVVAGGIAGGAAAAATNPLDVVKTRLQTEGVVSEATQYKTSSSSSFSVLRNIIQSEGYGALMHGMRPRIMFHAPAAAISWMTYETCKKFLSV